MLGRNRIRQLTSCGHRHRQSFEAKISPHAIGIEKWLPAGIERRRGVDDRHAVVLQRQGNRGACRVERLLGPKLPRVCEWR